MPRPGFVLDVDRSTPPILFWRGENYSLEKLPADRSRVIYAPEPEAPIDDIDAAIRHALLNPIEMDPLPTLLFPGMKLTIAFDDISLPLPKMTRPDIRQRVIESVLDLAAEAGVDDVHIIAALALHRRMTEDELRHMLGDRVYDAFAPRGMLYQHDAEDQDNLALLGETPHGEEVEINKRAAESDLLVYVNINLVAMDGGWKSTATGLSSYRSLRHHHNTHTMENSRSFMDQHKSELHKSNWRMGEIMKKHGPKIFQIETTVNNDTFPSAFDFLGKREWEWNARDRAKFVASSAALSRTPARMRRNIFQSIEAPHQMTSIQAGEVEAVLLNYPGVQKAAVIGRKTADGNEEILAFVEPKFGIEIDASALQLHAHTHLTAYKRPSVITVVADMPMTLSGKILKRELLQRISDD